MMTKYTVTDVNILPFKVLSNIQNNNLNFWLITSPEYHMKRLLATGIGPIYQICHAFRDTEISKLHNPEFTILEWYQPFYNMFDMIYLIDDFFSYILNITNSTKISYQNIFKKYFCIDPFNTNIKELNVILKKINHDHLIKSNNTISEILELIFMIGIVPKIGHNKPIFVYHYPANQAMLSTINFNNSCVADRFEIFYKGLELGNGFYELIDSFEQKKRFEKDNKNRINNNLETRKLDFRFIKSLNSKYMPNCSGVALGIDRLIMTILKIKKINQILSFSVQDC